MIEVCGSTSPDATSVKPPRAGWAPPAPCGGGVARPGAPQDAAAHATRTVARAVAPCRVRRGYQVIGQSPREVWNGAKEQKFGVIFAIRIHVRRQGGVKTPYRLRP